MADRYLSLILPAYNEVGRIAGAIAEATAYLQQRGRRYEIIVVADGTDGTRELVADMAKTDSALKVMGGPKRRGKGFGIRQGVMRAEGEIIGFADADNKTPMAEFDKVEPLLRAGYHLVIGSRRLAGARIEQAPSLYRRLGSRGFNLLLHALLGLRDIPDTQCGFKFFQRGAAHALFAAQTIDGYTFDVEVLYLARRAGYRLAQVPVRWRHDGDSRSSPLTDSAKTVMEVLRIRFAHPHSDLRAGP